MAATDALMEGGQATFDKENLILIAGEKVSFELEPISVGLTKEQLEKYRNDPFWKPVRTVLFILFWLAWICMFAAAIAIVVFSPKCAEKKKPEWWQTKVSYQLLTQSFYDSDGDGEGDFKGITEKIDMLRKIGVTTVYPSPVLKTYKESYDIYEVIDHLAVDPRFGTEDDFKELVDAAHNRDMYVVMDLPISSVSLNHSWFQEADSDYFITSNSDKVGKTFYPFPRFNNTKYLGYPSERNPVINLKNARVFNTILDSVKKFLLLGVDGFHIDHISQLAVNADGTSNISEAMSRLNSLTSSIKNIISSHDEIAEKKIVLFSSLHNIEDLHHADATGTGELNYIIDSDFASLSTANCSSGVAKCVHDALDKAYNRYKANGHVPYWQFSNAENRRLASRFDAPTANLLNFMQMTLPGAISLYYGQELGLKDNSKSGAKGIMQWAPRLITSEPLSDNHHGFTKRTDSIFFGESDDSDNYDNFESQYNNDSLPLKLYQKLAKLRQREEALLVGETIRDTIKGDVISYSRFVRSNDTITGPVFTVILNFGSAPVTVNMATLEHIPKDRDLTKAEVVAFTRGVSGLKARDKKNYLEENVVLPGKEAILIKL